MYTQVQTQVLAHADLQIEHNTLSVGTYVAPEQDHAASILMFRAPASAAVNTMAEEGLRAGPKQVGVTLQSKGVKQTAFVDLNLCCTGCQLV